MKSIMIMLVLSSTAFAARLPDYPEVPPIDDTPQEPPPPVVAPAPPAYPNDLPHSGYPIAEPAVPVIGGYLPKRVPWTDKGDHFIRDYVLQVCQGETPYRCQSLAGLQPARVNGDYDWGVRIYRKDNGAYLGTIDRNIGEEVTRDDATISIDAYNRHPESRWIGQMEAEKAKLEYIAAACATGAVYCSGMASKLPDGFKTLFTTACSLWSGLCMTKVADMKLQYQQRIDYVKQQCAIGDQACFDAVTNGGETKARADFNNKYGPNSGSGSGALPGERPPHESVGRPTTFGDGDPMQWYDPSCKHCKITDSDPDGSSY